MRKAIFPIVCLLLLGAGVAIGWFVGRRGTFESEQKETVKKTVNEAALERVNEAEDALRLAGFEYAFVYRWRGAALDGSLLVEKSGEPERVALGPVPENPDQLYPSFRGLVVIAIRPKVAGIAGQECLWAVMTTVEAKEGLMVASGTPSSGRLPELSGAFSGASSSGGAFHKLGLPGGKEWELIELTLVKPK